MIWIVVLALLALAVLVVATRKPGPEKDLAITALYTNGTWTWGRLPGAELLASRAAKTVFDCTNLALAATKPLTRAPSLRCSLLQRHVIIDKLLEAAGAKHVLELAAGLSRRGVAVSADPSVTYTEVDRPGVVAIKRKLLGRSAEGRAVLARPNLRLAAADLAGAALEPFCSAPPATPLFVVAEGLFMYPDAAGRRALWRRIRALFDERPGTLVFDLVPNAERPKPGFAGRALELVLKATTRGATLEQDGAGRDQIAAELRDLGFAVELVEPATAPWPLPHAEVPTQQLVFVCRRG